MEQEQQTPSERALALIRPLLPDWQPTTQDVLRWIRIAIAVGHVILGVLLILDVVSDIFGIKLWNLLKVLAVPITVGAAVPWLNWLQKKRELDVENQRAQDEARQAYITEVGSLITEYSELSLETRELEDRSKKAEDEYKMALTELEDKNQYWRELREEVETQIKQGKVDDRGMVQRKVGGGSINPAYVEDKLKESEAQVIYRRNELVRIREERGRSQDHYIVRRSVIRAQTLTALERVGEQRKRAIMRLLAEAEVVKVGGETEIIELRDADFSGADLSHMDLTRNSLEHIRFTKANLASTNLTDADLSDSDLSNANLSNATVTRDQLDKCKSVEGATLPDRLVRP